MYFFCCCFSCDGCHDAIERDMHRWMLDEFTAFLMKSFDFSFALMRKFKCNFLAFANTKRFWCEIFFRLTNRSSRMRPVKRFVVFFSRISHRSVKNHWIYLSSYVAVVATGSPADHKNTHKLHRNAVRSPSKIPNERESAIFLFETNDAQINIKLASITTVTARRCSMHVICMQTQSYYAALHAEAIVVDATLLLCVSCLCSYFVGSTASTMELIWNRIKRWTRCVMAINWIHRCDYKWSEWWPLIVILSLLLAISRCAYTLQQRLGSS